MTDTNTPSLNPSRIQEASFCETGWRAVVNGGVTLDEILHPLFWAHVAHRLKPHDRISVVTDDNAFWYDLLVISTGKERAYVTPLNAVDINAAMDRIEGIGGAIPASLTSATVAWKGPQAKYCVLHGETVVQSKFATKAEAQSWLSANADKKAA